MHQCINARRHWRAPRRRRRRRRRCSSAPAARAWRCGPGSPELGDGLDDGPELVGAGEAAGAGGARGVDVEGDAALAELEPRHLRRAGRRADEAPPASPSGTTCGHAASAAAFMAADSKTNTAALEFLVPRPSVRVCHAWCARMAKLVGMYAVVVGANASGAPAASRRRRGGGAELERRGAAHGERAGDELGAEPEPLHVAARPEQRVQRRRRRRRRGVVRLGLAAFRLLGRRRRVMAMAAAL